MPHPPRKAKRAKIMAHKPSGTEGRVGSGSLVVLTPAKTRRGKIFYKEVDATPYYELSDDEEGTSKRKPSKTPKDSIPIDPAPLEDISRQEALLDDEPYIPRTTKVRRVWIVLLYSNKN